MKAIKLHHYHKRCVKLMGLILHYEGRSQEIHYSMDAAQLIEPKIENLAAINKELDLNNNRIRKAWKLYKRTKADINRVHNLYKKPYGK